jgi:hypothetical protein
MQTCWCQMPSNPSTYEYVPGMYHFVPSTYLVHPIIDGVSHRWTAAELKKVIAMLQNPEFD